MWLISINNMAFNEKELEIIKYGVGNGKTKEQVQKALTNFRLGQTTPKEQPQEQTFLQDAGSDLGQIVTDTKKSLSERGTKMGEAMDAAVEGKQGVLRTIAQQAGQGFGAISDIFGNVIKGVVKSVLPQKSETAIKTGVEDTITPVMQTDLVKGVIEKYNSLDEKTKRDIDSALGVGSFALDVATLGGGAKVGEQGVKIAGETALKAGEVAGQVAEEAGKIAGGALDVTKNIAKGTGTLIESGARGASRIPERIATNVAEKEATLQAIKTLPTKVAQIAAQDGVDVGDVKYLYQLPKTQKTPLKNLYTAVKDFSNGTSKTNPIEVVGKPIVARIKQLDSAKGEIGQKLGKVAETLGNVSSEELTPQVLTSLQKVPGLNGIKISNKGILDFTDTVLASSETASDRKAIQQIFSDAIKSGTGKQKHLLRQELFESLGGKKGSLTTMTDTQDKAYQAIRQGLSNVLEGKNSSYKTLSNEYRKVAQPLTDIRKFMKNVAGADEDILNMNAGLLARRLTSNAQSNPQIRAILRAMDEATAKAGKSELSVENLQDFYNILDRYYDIAGKTTFQGQTASGVQKGIKGFILDNATKYVSKTDEVTKKALERAIEEALR